MKSNHETVVVTMDALRTKLGAHLVIAPRFIALHRCVFYKLKARPSPSQKIPTHFIVILASLRPNPQYLSYAYLHRS